MRLLLVPEMIEKSYATAGSPKNYPVPNTQCMVYFPTFTITNSPNVGVYIYIPYIECLGSEKENHLNKTCMTLSSNHFQGLGFAGVFFQASKVLVKEMDYAWISLNVFSIRDFLS